MHQATGHAQALSASAFERDGFVIVRGLAAPEFCARLRRALEAALRPLMGPAEFEADLGYPGAPTDMQAVGGRTPRRLLHAASRFPMLREWATGQPLRVALSEFLPGDLRLSQCHHNCVMTKHPGYSSATLWHQDIRYWSFDRPELVSVWLALGEETNRNGALKIVPGSHRLQLDRGRFDRDLFLRPDLPQNKALIRQAAEVLLEPGDALFFHCRAIHAAGKNRSEAVKLSCVFTYHEAGNRPIPGTRSDRYPSLPL